MGAKAQTFTDHTADDAPLELTTPATDRADVPEASNVNFRPHVEISQEKPSRLTRLFHGISTRLQFMALFLSLVGIGFGVKSYWHVRDEFGVEASADFIMDLYVQIGIAIAINIVAGILIAATVSKPLLRLSETMRKLTENKLDVDVPFTNVPNELGSMARKVQVFKDNAIQMRKMETEQEKAREQNEIDRKKLLNDLAAEFDSTVRAIVNQVTSSATHMQSTSQSMKSSTEDSNKRICDLTKEMARTTENVNSVAAAGEELTASIKEIATQVNRSTNIIQEAVDKSKVANENINALSDGAQKIEEIIGIINDIAEQINLLALNATIEAARAGEAGKGFAVVASEVKNLASQTAKATEQISSFIQDIQGKTGATVTSIESINKTIEEMTAISDTISEAVREQDNATREIAGHIQEAANNTNEVSTNVGKVQETSTHIGEEAGDLLDATNGLTQNSAHLNDEVARFIERLKSA